MPVVRRDAVARWVDLYERAWRTAGTALLAELFTPAVTYQPCSGDPVQGQEELARFWDAERAGPDEPFMMMSEIVAVEDDTAVVRVTVDYAAFEQNPAMRWRNLWVVRFTAGGRCVAFEEWSAAPEKTASEQEDGGAAPS